MDNVNVHPASLGLNVRKCAQRANLAKIVVKNANARMGPPNAILSMGNAFAGWLREIFENIGMNLYRPGRIGPLCQQECPTDKYGFNCSLECDCHGAAGCDPITGCCHCPKGRFGSRCQFGGWKNLRIKCVYFTRS